MIRCHVGGSESSPELERQTMCYRKYPCRYQLSLPARDRFILYSELSSLSSLSLLSETELAASKTVVCRDDLA